jgi:hypothetical protein
MHGQRTGTMGGQREAPAVTLGESIAGEGSRGAYVEVAVHGGDGEWEPDPSDSLRTSGAVVQALRDTRA